MSLRRPTRRPPGRRPRRAKRDRRWDPRRPLQGRTRSAVPSPDAPSPDADPPGAEDQPPHYLVQRVREALAHDPRVNELEIKVKIYGRKVFATGTVPTQERRDAISGVIEDVLPGFTVHNETTVATLPEPSEAEELS